MDPEQEINNIKPRTRQERVGRAHRRKRSRTKKPSKRTGSTSEVRSGDPVGYEARNIDVKMLIHNTDPHSDLFCPGGPS